MLIEEVYRNADVCFSGNKYTTINELTDQIPALRPTVLWEAALELYKLGKFSCNKIVTEEDKGAPLGTAVSLISGKPLAIARWYPYELTSKQAIRVPISSEYYEGILYLNGINENDHVTIVDDTISSGGAVIAMIEAIRKAGATVDEVLCLIEKANNGGVHKVFDETGISVKTFLKINVDENGVTII